MYYQSILKTLFSRRVAFGATLGGAVLFMVIGVVIWGGFNWGMAATNTTEFCISCHEMEENVYQEYIGTAHDANRSGVRAGCPDCHVPRPWRHKIVRKIQASNEVLHKILGTVSTPEKFDAHRLTMAKRVWKAMKNTDSRECRNCHDWDTMDPQDQQPRARNQHLFAMNEGHTCIDCHKGIAHQPAHTELSQEELDRLAAPVEAYQRAAPASFIAGLERAEAAETQEAARQQEQARLEREQRKAAAREQQAHLEAAVAAALAAQKEQLGNEAAAAPTPAGAEPAARGFGVDWSAAPERLITLFYPGQTSMEWTLVGRHHGGARPFQAGDRCVTCHDKETAAMGEKMVSGEKAEPTPIPGKRGSIPVSVRAAHDAENLYLRFEWEAGEHAPVPFADGGKLDPEHQVKLGAMFATDAVEYASQAGCWGACHHDLRGMPAHPEDPTAAGLELDLANGVSKYLKESRTHVEEKGRRGKTLGGWDQLKETAAIQQQMEQGRFMDLLRWSSGDRAENGHVLAERVMQGGAEIEAQGWEEAGYWTVVIKRPLQSSQPGDLAIELGTQYNFGFAIHDDYADARFHHVSLGYKLGLDDPEAEINAVKTEVSAPAATAPAPDAAATGEATASEPDAAPDAGIDWSKAGERLITLFYPGQTSMEWTLVGRHHGGARPFQAGDRCVTCHDKETAAMGEKMVSGEKAEPAPIPGKRGSIPVSVLATHDAENLYLKFEWEDGGHAPVPFADGGKLDPDNPVKLALMLAGDEVEYAAQAGCWGACHHDLRGMPEHPADPAASGLELDFSQGVTKYLKESRTHVEEKGRRGKTLGGWDQLKEAAAIEEQMQQGHFMDLLRINSGDGSTENGYVLAQRIMQGGQGFEASLTQEAGYWTAIFKRKLQSEAPGDLSLEPGKLYNLGFAIHDDYADARFHHVSLGYKLGLDHPEAEVNAVGQ